MLPDLTRTRAADIFAAAARDVLLLVVGDVILDSTVYGNVTRISAEAPVPVVDCLRTVYAPGGAANVACGISALDGHCVLLALGGDPTDGQQLTQLLPDRLSTRFIGRSGVPRKQRIVANGQQIARLDHAPVERPTPQDAVMLGRTIKEVWPVEDAILLSDYNLGTITPELFKQLKRHGYRLLLDPHPLSAVVPVGAALLKPNRNELYRLAELRPTNAPAAEPLADTDLLTAVQRVEQRFQPEELLVTLGAQGLLVKTRTEPLQHVPALAGPPVDVCGAGDTVFATYALARAGNATPVEAAQLANVAARVVINKPGTATCLLDELMALL